MPPEVRGTLRRLGASFAVAYLAFAMTAGPGPAAYVRLSGNLGDAGLYFALAVLFSAAGAGAGGALMDRLGRKPVLLGAHLLMALGYALMGLGVQGGALLGFVAGIAAAGVGMGAAFLTRLAAADLFPPAERGRGVAWVLVSATAGAVAGPLLLVGSEPLGALLGRDPATLVWFLAPPLLLLSAGLVATMAEPMATARATGLREPAPGAAGEPDRPTAARLVAAGTTAIALSGGAMVGVMGIAGAVVQQAHHGTAVLGATMAAHFVGMFGLAPLVGRFADLIGRRSVIVFGLALSAAGGLGVAVLPGATGFAVALFTIGLGWSFSYLGASVLLADVTPMARRARVLGRADLLGALCQAGLAALAGAWFAQRGAAGVGLVAAALLALPLVLVLLAVHEPRPGVYAQTAAA